MHSSLANQIFFLLTLTLLHLDLKRLQTYNGVLTLYFVPIGLWVVWGVKGGIWLPEVKGSSTVSWTNQSRELHVNNFLHINMFDVM